MEFVLNSFVIIGLSLDDDVEIHLYWRQLFHNVSLMEPILSPIHLNFYHVFHQSPPKNQSLESADWQLAIKFQFNERFQMKMNFMRFRNNFENK